MHQCQNQLWVTASDEIFSHDKSDCLIFMEICVNSQYLAVILECLFKLNVVDDTAFKMSGIYLYNQLKFCVVLSHTAAKIRNI